MLVNGKWDAEWHPVQKKDKDGRFVRQTSSFRSWIDPQDATPGRYHLVVALICPWASRTLVTRSLVGLEDVISVSIVRPQLTEYGWSFGTFPGTTGDDELIGAQYVHELYTHTDPTYTGRATVPILWDKQERTIVNNESADIVRILNSSFRKYASSDLNLYPEALHTEIDALNERMYERINNGVYKAGFATTQKAYDEAVTALFDELTAFDDLLADGRRYLVGDQLTEADIRLFVTLIRFDAAYFGLFKCNLKPLRDFEYLHAHTRRLYEVPEIRKTVNIEHIKQGYYSVKALNPNGIVPMGPSEWT